MGEVILRRELGHTISITNTESMYHALQLPDHLQYIRNSDFSCCDGVGVVLAGKLLGSRIPRLHGPDLMAKCCEYGISQGWRHFFYGGREGVPETLSEKLIEKYPNLIVAGKYAPPFRPLTWVESEEVTARINSCRPDIVWVGLGLLKQERWISEQRGKIEVPWMIGVGAAFDFHALKIKRAPLVFQQAGMEWLYRLVFEPRMFIRNIRSSLVLYYTVREFIRKRLERDTE